MDEQWFREQLANEYRKIGHYDSSVTVRQGNLAPIDLAAIAAMKIAYQRGWGDQCDIVSACLV